MITSRVALPAVVGLVSVLFILCGVTDTLGASVSLKRLKATSTSTKGKVQPASSKNNTVMHANFANAGKKNGLEIWRIENFAPVAYPKTDYGKFYTGDSYIVLNTKENGGSFSWDIHYWLGNETSQDESGSAAIFAVQLDDGLGGVPVQYREVQEHETELFLSYFKSSLRYLPGGISSGFKHTDINPNDPKRLYLVKGKKNVRVIQVPVDIKSINHGDCYILDAGGEIYTFCGEKSKRTERLVAATTANEIRDEDHKGRGRVTKIEIGESTPEEIEEFFKILGSGSLNEVAPAPATDDDEAFEKKQAEIVTLHKVSDASGTLKVEKVASKPLKQSSLKTDDCFILDTGTSGIYAWIGKKGTATEKSAAMKNAEDFLKQNNKASWIQITRVVEGGEPAAFKQYFSEWKE